VRGARHPRECAHTNAGNQEETAMSTAVTAPTGTWDVDPSHSRVGFAVKHLGISTVRGQFNEFEGKLELGDDASSTKATGSVQVGSIDTGQPDRDGRLLNSDFFDAEKHPQLTFESTSIELGPDGQVKVTGDLTIMGTTKPVTLTGLLGGTENDPFGNLRVGLEMHGEINRTDFGMTFNIPLDSGALAMSDTVALTLDISAVKAA
jgi:polyisoprenoid-binding protein YceI